MEKRKKKKIIKIVLGIIFLGIVSVAVAILIIFKTPHRDVKNTETDFTINAKTLVDEYLENSELANKKYLAEDGDSKIFEVTGRVDQIFKNQKSEDVILLKPENKALGVQCTFILGELISSVVIGNQITVKGKIEKGASIDKDLEIGEDVLIGQCSLVK
jgi:hypothetical protein